MRQYESCQEWRACWQSMIDYYMEDENIPKDDTNQYEYYRKARMFLSSRLFELWIMLKEKESRTEERMG